MLNQHRRHSRPRCDIKPENILVDKQGRVKTRATSAGSTDRQSKRLTAYFLFRGNEPLDLTLTVQSAFRATAMPADDKAAHSALLSEWWAQFTAARARIVASDAYPPLIENYLVAMLGQRLHLRIPKLPSVAWGWLNWRDTDDFFTTLSGFESVRLAAQTDVFLKDTHPAETANQPLPKPAALPPISLPEDVRDVAVEPIARHVPEECFYVRCRSFANFRWLRSRIEDWGTYLRDVASMRGLDYGIMPRLEKQLALRETVLATLLGDAIISDVAVIGTDTFLREGASIGILFEARSRLPLELAIRQQRQEALTREDHVTERTVRIDGHPVSFLSTPDNRVRSFYAVDGDYHFVTTSKTLVRRFFEAGRNQKSLGNLKEFRWARSKEPLSKDHTIFVYLSDPFFRLLISPQYRIEMTRRVRAAAEIDAVRMARLASRAERQQAMTIEQLVEQNMLPAGFGHRPDGSHVVTAGNRLTDSLRGAYGCFLPVPDVTITGATPSEVQAYQKFAERFNSIWQRMDPIVIAIERQPSSEGRKEHVVIDLHVTPFAKPAYFWLTGLLSAEDSKCWQRDPGDMALLQAQFQKDKIAFGVQDFQPKFKVQQGRLVHLGSPQDNVPYYMIVPLDSHSFLSKLETTGESDGEGNLPVKGIFEPFGRPAWARKHDGYYVLSSNKRLLGQVVRHVKLVDAARPARARIWLLSAGLVASDARKKEKRMAVNPKLPKIHLYAGLGVSIPLGTIFQNEPVVRGENRSFDWKAFIKDLHTGRLFGERLGFLWSDAIALLPLLLLATGTTLYAVPSQKQRKRKSRRH